MRITVIGIGNVGLALGTYLSSSNEVNGIDIKKVDAPFKVTLDYKQIKDTEAFFITVPTSFMDDDNRLDTASIREIVERILKVNKKAPIFIKSTVNVGFTRTLIDEFNYHEIYYTPEFLREATALEDIAHPDRVVIGCLKEDKNVKLYLSLFNTKKKFVLPLEEAEAVKLFANTYLATRIAFFNELDTYAEENNLDSRRIIEAVSADKRIGDYYNKPSYGYGGYCLPKDSKELDRLYNEVPHKLIEATVESNEERKKHVLKEVYKRTSAVYKPLIGIYEVPHPYSPLFDIMNEIKSKGMAIVVYTEEAKEATKFRVTNDLERFIKETTVILSDKEVPNEIKKLESTYIK